MHNAFWGSTGPGTLKISGTWLKRSNFAEGSTWVLGVFLIIDLFLPLFSVYVILDKRWQYFLLIHVLGPEWCHIGYVIIGLEHTSLNEGTGVNVFSIQDNKLLLLVTIFFEDVHLDFEVLFVEGFIGREVAFGIEWDGFGVFEVLFLWRGDFFRGWLGFFVSRFNSEHLDWLGAKMNNYEWVSLILIYIFCFDRANKIYSISDNFYFAFYFVIEFIRL